jgi:hypothetical protein
MQTAKRAETSAESILTDLTLKERVDQFLDSWRPKNIEWEKLSELILTNTKTSVVT